MPDLSWQRIENPTWDAAKQRVIGGAPDGAFALPFAEGDSLPGEWWSAHDGGPDGPVVGYGRLDIGWGGDAEVLLAVDPERQTQGIGSFVLTELEREAADRGINYVYNTIPAHEQRDLVHDWLIVRGFRGAVDGDLRKRVGKPPTQPANTTPVASPAYDPVAAGDRGPGHEESGGYVDVDNHQF